MPTLQLTLNRPLCLSCRSKLSRPALCSVTMGTRAVAARSLLFALARNQSTSEGGDGWARVGGDVAWHGMVEVIQHLKVHCCFVPKLEALLKRGERPLYLTTSALSSTQHLTPDPDKICICNSLQNDTTPPKITFLYQLPHCKGAVYFGVHGAELLENRYSVLFLMWQCQQPAWNQ